MATHGEQGAGKHPHKSSEEPYPHTKGEGGGRQEERSRDGSRSQAGGRGGQQGGGQEKGSREGSRGEGGGEGGDLKSREYRDEKGEVHHHTRTYQEQHKGERGGE